MTGLHQVFKNCPFRACTVGVEDEDRLKFELWFNVLPDIIDFGDKNHQKYFVPLLPRFVKSQFSGEGCIKKEKVKEYWIGCRRENAARSKILIACDDKRQYAYFDEIWLNKYQYLRQMEALQTVYDQCWIAYHNGNVLWYVKWPVYTYDAIEFITKTEPRVYIVYVTKPSSE